MIANGSSVRFVIETPEERANRESTCRNVNRYDFFTCSKCGAEVVATQVLDCCTYLEINVDGKSQGPEGFNYCPNCGAKVVKQ